MKNGVEGLYYVLSMLENGADVITAADLDSWPPGKEEPERMEPLLVKKDATSLAADYAREKGVRTAVVQLIGAYVPETKITWEDAT